MHESEDEQMSGGQGPIHGLCQCVRQRSGKREDTCCLTAENLASLIGRRRGEPADHRDRCSGPPGGRQQRDLGTARIRDCAGRSTSFWHRPEGEKEAGEIWREQGGGGRKYFAAEEEAAILAECRMQ